MTERLVLQYRVTLRGVQNKHRCPQNTALRHFRHHVNQFAPTTIRQDILRPIREKLCQNRQQRSFKAHRAGWLNRPKAAAPLN